MTKTSPRPKKTKAPAAEEATGTYKFDRELGRMVKVSARVPGLKKGGSAPEMGPCGRPRGGGSGRGPCPA